MLVKNRRITEKKEFERVFKEGAFVREGFISLRVREARGEETRFGFVVGQKISKKAVLRNRIKRRLRAAIERLIKEVRPGKEVVVLPSPDIVKKDFQEIFEKIEKTLRKARVL